MTSPDNSQYPALIDALNEGFRLAGEAVKSLVDTFNRGIDNINNNPLIYLAPDFVSGLHEKLEKLRGYISKFVMAMQEFLKHQAPIISLIETSFDWLTKMRKPVSGMVGPAEQPKDPNLDAWEGGAALHYNKRVVPSQTKALSQLHPKADAISLWLIDVAKASITFLTTYAAKVAELAGVFVAMLVDASTIIGALEAAGKAGEFAGTIVKEAVTVFTGSIEYYSTAIGFMRDAVSIQTDVEAFPNDAWPSAVN